jgi:hypothetical protein
MAPAAIPEILYKEWFWLPIAAGLIIAACFARRKNRPPFPRMRGFFARHERVITRINDILLICVVLIPVPFLPYVVGGLFNALPDHEPARTVLLQSAWAFLFMSLIVWSGISGFFIGLLSVFQSNLTKTKRIILLILCLLPVTFTVLAVLTDIPETRWSIVQLCLYFSAGSWIVNAPAIIVGKHISTVLSDITRKVKSAFGKCSS